MQFRVGPAPTRPDPRPPSSCCCPPSPRCRPRPSPARWRSSRRCRTSAPTRPASRASSRHCRRTIPAPERRLDASECGWTRSPRTRRSAPPRSGSSTTPPATRTRCTCTRCVFEVVDRQDACRRRGDRDGPGRPRHAHHRRPSRETGFKDTVIAYPGQVTRIKAQFDNPGPVRVALPHRRARGQRDDAAVPHRTASSPASRPRQPM